MWEIEQTLVIVIANSPAKLIVVDPMEVSVGRGSIQDTVIPSSAVLDRVDVIVVSVNAVSVTV